jgi:hypothetical protein
MDRLSARVEDQRLAVLVRRGDFAVQLSPLDLVQDDAQNLGHLDLLVRDVKLLDHVFDDVANGLERAFVRAVGVSVRQGFDAAAACDPIVIGAHDAPFG